MTQQHENSDLELVQEVKEGSERRRDDSWSQLYVSHRGSLSGLVGRSVPSDDVEDVVQEVFLKSYINIRQFAGSNTKGQICSFSTWLHTIARNESVNYWRKKGYRKSLKNPVPVFYDIDENPEIQPYQLEDNTTQPPLVLLENRSIIERISQHVRSLDNKSIGDNPQLAELGISPAYLKVAWESLILSETKDMSLPEIARELDTSVPILKKARHFTRRYLQEKFYSIA